jgi:adenylate cyclase
MAESSGAARSLRASGLAGRAVILFRQLGFWRLATTAIFLALGVLVARFSWDVPFVANAEGVLFDYRSAWSAPKVDQDDRIALVVYDDDTLILTGKRSPLDRAILAKALRRIDAMHPKSIGIDILFDQKQPEDQALIDAFRSMKTPTWLAYASNANASDKITYEQQQFLESFQKSLAPGNVHPTSIRLEEEADGGLRRWPPRPKGLPPTMPNALDPASPDFQAYQGSIAFRLPKDRDRDVFSVIPIQNFADDAVFAIPAAADLYRKQIEGRHVVIGGHIQDVDLFQTPLKRVSDDAKPMWGMDIFAHMLVQQIDHRALTPSPDWALWLAAFAVAIAGAVTALSNLRPFFLGVLLLIQIAVISILPFQLHNHMVDTFGLPVFGWVIGWAISFSSVGTAARAVGSEQRKFAQSALGKYLPRDIAAEILRDPDGLKLHGEKREIFVVFTDLEGFTKLSHAIEPEMVATLLNRYLEMLSDVVLEHGGTIDKFVGDAVVSFWGAPISRPDDGERAARAALALHQAGETFRKSVPDGVPAIGKTRVGLHHGDAIVGNFGGEGRIQYTALGDSMNTAARLESANKQLKSSVLVSEDAAHLSGLDWYRSLGRIVLRGRATPIDVVEPVPDLSAEERKAFNEVAARANRGDVSAITTLHQKSISEPHDAALENFVYRLNHQDKGGYFVLD